MKRKELVNTCLSRWVLFFCIIFIGSCTSKTKEIDKIQLMGYEYYPIIKGSYNIYQVYYHSTPDTTISYQVKEITSDTLRVGSEILYKLERYQRNNENEPWPEFPKKVWTVSMRDNILLKTEDNIKFVKLVFPLKENNTWNGNVHNTEEPLTYRIKDLGRPYNQFNETLKVVQGSEDSTLVKKVYRLEVFAKNTGLIYKQYDNFIYNQDVDFGKYKLSNGSTRYIERIVEQGKF